MRVLLDQGFARSVTDHLVASGHEALHVGDIGLSSAQDAEILDFAPREDRVVVTYDADFHAILARERMAKPSVIRFRIESLKTPQAVLMLRFFAGQSSAGFGGRLRHVRRTAHNAHPTFAVAIMKTMLLFIVG